MRHLLPRLKVINNVLFVGIVVIDAYIIGTPFFPAVFERPAAVKVAPVVHRAKPAPLPARPKPAEPNQLIIPVMQLDGQVYEGTDTYTELDKGVWHWPGSSTPDKGSNTVLLGHRFTYTNPRGIFYFLNLVKVGDEITMLWNNSNYIYRVDAVKVVSPDHTEILQPTTEPTLTIYTCTPTWWPKDRLVVTAHLEKQS